MENYELIQMNWKAKYLLIHGTLNKIDDNITTLTVTKEGQNNRIWEDIGNL